jgi:uncharacterized membrane protein YuzA (DUF378 family)
MLHGTVSAVLFIVAGIVGALPIDMRIAWVLVAIAGLLMILPV